MKKRKEAKSEIFVVIIVAAVLVFLLSSFGFMGYGGMMGGNYNGYGMMFFGWIYGVLILIALVLLIIWLMKQIQKK
ncbi:MAG: hypothetical protein NUV46_04030 [Nanoarchaeota archaeon]|nr:hypothetical protein [Nanoarchaeota archaeon]